MNKLVKVIVLTEVEFNVDELEETDVSKFLKDSFDGVSASSTDEHHFVVKVLSWETSS